MHELSIAEALVAQVRRHTPAETCVTSVRVGVGAKQCLAEESMALAWEAMTADTELEGAKLQVSILPWSLTCAACRHQWSGDGPLDCCPACGSKRTEAAGSNDISLLSMEVMPMAEAQARRPEPEMKP